MKERYVWGWSNTYTTDLKKNRSVLEYLSQILLAIYEFCDSLYDIVTGLTVKGSFTYWTREKRKKSGLAKRGKDYNLIFDDLVALNMFMHYF